MWGIIRYILLNEMREQKGEPMSADLEEQYNKIYRYCYMKLGHRQTAEDLTQETLLNAVSDLAKHQKDYIKAMESCPQSDAVETILGLLDAVSVS